LFRRNEQHLQILQETFASVLTDPYFSVATKEAQICLEEAKMMVQCFGQTEDVKLRAQQSFADWLYESLAAVVSYAQGSAQKFNKEKMWIKFHELTSSLEFSEKWELFVSELGIGTLSPLLYQHITDVIFESIIEKKFTPASENSDSVIEDVSLTYEEENAIQYVAGYVIRQLRCDKANSQMLPLLEQLTENSPVADDPTHCWINQIDRGGLTRVTNEAFKCFCDIELIIRRFLHIDKTREMNDQFRKKVMDSVLQDEELLFDWLMASRLSLEDDISNNCLRQIVKKWLSIRGNSFARNVMESYKQESKKGTQKSKPLRSTLYTDNM